MADVTPVASLPFPELTDQPNVPDDINELAVALDHVVIPKYASTTARDNANTSPEEGDLCYVVGDGYYTYTGSDWTFVTLRRQFKRKTADESVFNSATYQTDDHLTGFVWRNGRRYRLRGELYISSGNTPDFKIQLVGTGINGTNFPTNGTANGFWYSHTTTAFGGHSRSARWSQGLSISTDRDADGGGYIDVAMFGGTVVNTSGSDITFSFQWAQNTANASTTTVHENSWMEFTEIG
jgi:hypothetical protein